MPLVIATWNVNGLRARESQLLEWLDAEQPDLVCLQELKCHVSQVPASLAAHPRYWSGWHGERAYSGVALLVARSLVAEAPVFTHPAFDFEQRVITADLHTVHGPLTVASLYVPNGGKDYEAKLRFLDGLDAWAADVQPHAPGLVLCGDLNVALTDRDIHAKERKPGQIGTRPDERERLGRLLGRGLVDVGRALEPDNDALFTWWAPWRGMRQRNIGWRIDYVVASAALATQARTGVVRRETGTSDHAPVVITFGD
jgi:exodeoxyribonuclease-3